MSNYTPIEYLKITFSSDLTVKNYLSQYVITFSFINFILFIDKTIHCESVS